MNNEDYVKHVVYLKEKMGLTWAAIGEATSTTSDKARSAYRRATGTHSPDQKLRKMLTEPEQFGVRRIETNGNETRIAFPTDEHYPFHDSRAIDLAMRLVSEFDPHYITSGSDGVDFYGLSKYNKNPVMATGEKLQETIDAWVVGQNEWRKAAPNAVPIFLMGNHEDRLKLFLWKKPALFGLDALKIKNLMKFASVGIFSPAVSDIVVDDILSIKHGSLVRKGAGSTARAELEKDGHAISTLTGHTHRGAQVFRSTRNGMIQGVEGFCLCDTNPHYVTGQADWQQGIVLVTIRDAILDIELLPFGESLGRLYTNWRGTTYWE